MQQGFAGRKGKAKAKKAARKAKKQALQHKDAEMMDTSKTAAEKDAGMSEEGQQEQQGGRAGHSAKVQLKRALKVKVAQLKQSRAKLTRLPGNKQARKQLSENIKEMVTQQHAVTKKKGKSKGAAAAGKQDKLATAKQDDGPAAMDE